MPNSSGFFGGSPTPEVFDRDLSRFRRVHEAASLADFASRRRLASGVWTMNLNGVPLDLRLSNRRARTTIVMLAAALGPRARTLPTFIGKRLTLPLPANLLFISDPSLALDPELRLAWYAGYRGVDLPATLARVIEHVQSTLRAKHLVLFGPSGGGFAAMSLGHLLPGSLAVAVNPQTRIEKYYQNAWQAYLSACYGATSRSEALAVLRDEMRSDVIGLYTDGFDNTVLYVQNALDSHVSSHLQPFVQAVGPHPRLGYLVGAWGKGHVPPSKGLLRQILLSAVLAGGRWENVLARHATHADGLQAVTDAKLLQAASK